VIDKICNNKYARYFRLIAFFYAPISIFVYAGAKSDKESPQKYYCLQFFELQSAK